MFNFVPVHLRRCLYFSPLPLLFILLWYLQPRVVEFESLDELKRFADANGLHRHSGALHDRESAHRVIFVADRAIHYKELSLLNPNNCVGNPAWKGIAMLMLAGVDDKWHVASMPPGDVGRLWGKLVVIGDPPFLDRLELLRKAR